MTLLDPFPGNAGKTTRAPAPVPIDADARLNWLRQNLPEYAALATPVDIVAAPIGSTRAVRTSGNTEDFVMTDAEDLVLIVNDYVGRNDSPGSEPVTTGAVTPATATTAGDSAVGVSIAGVAAADAVIGTKATAEDIRAVLETAIQALAPALPDRNNAAYANATVAYSAPTFATTLKTALASGVEIFNLVLNKSTGLKAGDEIVLKDLAASEPDLVRTVIQIERKEQEAIVTIERFTPAGDYAADSIVQSSDDGYVVTGGKRGEDQLVVFTASAGGTDVSALLKLKAGDGAVQEAGTDAVGRQTFRFVASDFGDPAAADATEIANVLNRALTGAVATDAAGAVVVTVDDFGESKNVIALEGTTQALLDLSTTIVEGTNALMQLSLDSPEIVLILEVDTAGGGAVGLFREASLVRIERDKLVNVDGTDHSADVQWLVLTRPGRSA